MNVFATWLKQLGRPAVFAHRGASRAAPENSLAALRLAAGLGADGVEFDVQRCSSGELVVFHDRTLARCTGTIGSLAETPLSSLKQLTLDRVATSLGLRPTHERIPTLEEWLAAVPPGLFVNLEVKCDVLAEAEVAPECVRALRDAGLTDQAVLSSFHAAALLRAAGRDRRLALGALIDDDRHWRSTLAAGLLAGANAIHPPHTLVTPARVRLWHRLGYVVAVWTVDDPSEAQRCLDADADVLISNRPDRLRPVVERYRRPE